MLTTFLIRWAIYGVLTLVTMFISITYYFYRRGDNRVEMGSAWLHEWLDNVIPNRLWRLLWPIGLLLLIFTWPYDRIRMLICFRKVINEFERKKEGS